MPRFELVWEDRLPDLVADGDDRGARANYAPGPCVVHLVQLIVP